MHTKIFTITLLLLSFAVSDEHKSIAYEGISVKNPSNGGNIETLIVKREIPEVCKKVPLNNEMLWTGNYANPNVPKECISTFVHSTGNILPMKLNTSIETYGEIEMLKFIKKMQQDSSKLLIDARKEEWYTYRTIPGAINLPFHHIKERESFEFEFEHDIKILGVKLNKDESLDFSQAKTIVVFCNGPWCSQSVHMIKSLLALGYPAHKMKWYRGGMQDWLAAGLTCTKK